MSKFIALLQREMRLTIRQRGESMAVMCFGLLVVTLFPFALSPAPDVLARLAPGLMHLVMLLALLLGLDKFFQADSENGTLDILVQNKVPLPLYVLARMAGLWLMAALPLLLISPLYMLLLHVEAGLMASIMASLFMASWLVSLLGVGASALSLGARRAPMLVPLLLVPLYIPVMIFGVSMASNPLGSTESFQAFLFLAAMFILYLTLVPFLSAAALKAAVEAA